MKLLNYNSDNYNNGTLLPISEYQKRFFIEWAMSPHETLYNTSLVYKLKGNLSTQYIGEAVRIFVQQNEILLAKYSHDGKSCFKRDFDLNEYYQILSKDPSTEIESQIRSILDTPFDLTKDVLMKFHLIVDTEKSNEYYWVITGQHIITDAATAFQINKQIQDNYNLVSEGKTVSSEIEKTFTKAIEQESSKLTKEFQQESKDFWLSFLSGIPLSIPLPYKSGVDRKNLDSRLADKSGEVVFFELSTEQTTRLKAFSKQRRSTSFIVLSAIYGLVLSNYSNQNKILLSYPVNMRPRGFSDVLGCFVNNLPLKLDLDEVETLDELIAQLGRQRREVKKYQGYSLTNIIQDQREEKNQEINSFFNVGITQANLNAISMQLHDVQCENIAITNSKKCVSEIGLLFDEYSSDVIKFKFEYRKELFNKEMIYSFLEAFQQTLNDVISGETILLKEYNVLTKNEENLLLTKWNTTGQLSNENKNISQLFEKQVHNTPQEIAIQFEQKSWSYLEYNQQCNQLARHIQQQYIEQTGEAFASGTLVALYLDRGPSMLMGMMAILKAGGTYVPLDTQLPEERIRFILQDTNVKLLLSETNQQEKCEKIHPKKGTVFLDNRQEMIGLDHANLDSAIEEEHPAYVIYTSGTTGHPKGVIIPHRAVVNYVCNVREVMEKGIQRVDFSTNMSFDLSVTTTISALLLGKSVCIYPGDVTNVETYTKHLISNKIDFIKGTPSFLSNLPLDQLKGYKLKQAFVGGEKMDLNHLQHMSHYIEVIIDEYGPTETTVGTTHLQKSVEKGNVNSIGRPYLGYEVYILSPQGKLVPIGVDGELYIGGVGVALGYLNRPDLTNEKFIQNPFTIAKEQHKDCTLLYKTGDVARWKSDGTIEYRGRNDEQVKIRGYRVELDEITATLMDIVGVKKGCVVLSTEGNKQQLVAYIVSEETVIEQESIIEALSQILPDYMVPQSIVQVEELPLTINGKLDKKALPKVGQFAHTRKYIAPVKEEEVHLTEIWEKVLGIEQVGIEDEFFKIGGDSILSIQLASSIRKKGYFCEVKDVFECKTIQKLAKRIRTKPLVHVNTEQGILSGTFGLLPVQQWFFNQVEQDVFNRPNHWNQSFLVKVPVLDIVKLQQSIELLVSHHDAFRLCFQPQGKGDHTWEQKYVSTIINLKIKSLNVNQMTSEQIEAELTSWQSEFDYERGLVFQIGYIHGYQDGSARLFIAAHHLVIDTISWRIIIEDLQHLYEGGTLIGKGSSYRQWSSELLTYEKKATKQIEWWKNELLDNTVWNVDIQENHSSVIKLSKKLTHQLLYDVSAAYHTQVNDILLTAFIYALREVNNESKQVITLEGHGREELNKQLDISRCVGWFTTLFPLKLDIGPSLRHTILNVKEKLNKLPEKGLGFGVLASNKVCDLTFEKLSPVSFNYLGQLDSDDRDWKIVREPSGLTKHKDNISPYVLDVNGYVTEGELSFSIDSKLATNLTHIFCESFEFYLRDTVEHCIEKYNREGGSYSSSDFDTVNVSQTLLDQYSSQMIEKIYPANSLQQGMIYHAVHHPDDDAYRVQLLFDYHEELNLNLYTRAWKLCLERFPALRTSFNWQEEIIQLIHKEGILRYDSIDISHLKTEEERKKEIDSILKKDRDIPFDLTQPTLFRLYIIKQKKDHYTLLKTDHHSISDGWSGPVLLTYLHECYLELKQQKNCNVIPDLAYFETQEYTFQHQTACGEYWQNALKNIENANDITPLLSHSIDLSTYRRVEKVAANTIDVKGEIYQQMKVFAKNEGLTINVVMQFLWHKLLQVYSHQSQSIVGTTFSGREMPIEDIEQSVGLYINTLPLIVQWDKDISVLSILKMIRQRIVEMSSHSFVSLAKLQQESERLFHTLFIYENYPFEENNSNQIDFSFKESIEKVDYPLSLIIYENKEALTIKIQYDSTYLEESKAKKHLESLVFLLKQVLETPTASHAELTIMRKEEQQRMLNDWNNTSFDFPPVEALHHVFEKHVDEHPDTTALIFEGQSLTYGELNVKSNQLAHHIKKEYAKRTNDTLRANTLIALFLERSPEMIVGILAVLKTGAAYVPIDTSYPQERVDYILEDTNVELIISQSSLLTNHVINIPSSKCIEIDFKNTFYQSEPIENIHAVNKGTDLAYIIYTSGTTGKPKGVMIEHEGVLNYTFAQHEVLNKPQNKKFYLLHSYAFDTSISCVFGALCHGNTLVLTSDTNRISSHIFNKYQIQIAYIPPALLSSLYPDNLTTLETIVVSGESSQTEVLKRFRHIPLLNEYGPTEATVGTTFHWLNNNFQVNIIGNALPNKKLYVLNQEKKLVPPGVVGELYVGGKGIARGYLNQEKLTKDRFLLNPFHEGNSRLYRTGDLVRWTDDAKLEFVGRNDDQVKLRGYRIELLEIERAISQIKGIKQGCVVLVNKPIANSHEKCLVGYFVPMLNSKIGTSDVQQILAQKLPAYMIPQYWVKLEVFPLTINGKLDKKKLPLPDFDITSDKYEPPITNEEKQACHLWETLLGVKQIGITDDFFHRGGNSILALQLSHQMSHEFNVDIKVSDIFQYKNIKNLIELFSSKVVNTENEEWVF